MMVAWTRVAAVQVGEVTDSRGSLRGGVQENLKRQGDSKTFCLRTCKDRMGEDCVSIRAATGDAGAQILDVLGLRGVLVTQVEKLNRLYLILRLYQARIKEEHLG